MQSFQAFSKFDFLYAQWDIVSHSYDDIFGMFFDFDRTFLKVVLLCVKSILHHRRLIAKDIAAFDDLAVLMYKPGFLKNTLKIIFDFVFFIDQQS